MITSFEDLILLIAFLLPIVPASFLIVSICRNGLSFPKRRAWIMFLLFSVLLHPFTQVLYLGPLDDKLNSVYLRKANEIHLVGKNFAEVQTAFGIPGRITTYPPSVYNGEQFKGYVLWEYKPLPWFWIGCSFQVAFSKGVVESYEGFDN